MNNVSKVVLTVLFLIASFAAIGCKTDNVMAPEQNAGNLQIGIKSAEVAVNPVITLNTAKFLFSDIVIRNIDGSRLSHQVYGPVVGLVNITTTGQAGSNQVSQMSVMNILPGDYNQIDFMIQNDQEYENRTVSAEFFGQPLTTEKFTTVIKGYYNNVPFVYRSNIVLNKQMPFHSTLTVKSIDDMRNVALVINPEIWFKENGVTLNPNDASNKQLIDQNIQESFTGVILP